MTMPDELVNNTFTGVRHSSKLEESFFKTNEFSNLQSKFNQTFMKDNLDPNSRKDIGRYLKCLGKKLSVPKFAPTDPSNRSPNGSCSRL